MYSLQNAYFGGAKLVGGQGLMALLLELDNVANKNLNTKLFKKEKFKNGGIFYEEKLQKGFTFVVGASDCVLNVRD